MAEPGGKTLCAEIILGVYLGFWLHPTKRPWWVKKASSWSSSRAVLLQNPNRIALQSQRLEAIADLSVLSVTSWRAVPSKCAFTLKISSPSTYNVIGVKDRNHSALPSQKLVGNPFHLIVLSFSLYWFFSPFDLLIVKHTLNKEKKFWSHNSTDFWSLH